MSAPPLGLLPERLFVRQRVVDILGAMHRYSLAGNAVPIEWVRELWRLVDPMESPEVLS